MSSIGSQFKILGLSMLALCSLAALTATSAQANWLENGVVVTANKSVLAKAHTTIKLVISSLNFEIRCPTLVGENLEIVGSSTKAEGAIKFSGCKGFQISNGAVQNNCEPFTGTEKGVIKAGDLALIQKYATVKHGVLSTWILFEAATGKPFSTIELPELCALAQSSKVTGSVILECGELNGSSVFVSDDCSVARVSHLLQPGPTVVFNGAEDETKVEDSLKFGTNAAVLSGIAAVELASKNTWAGDA